MPLARLQWALIGVLALAALGAGIYMAGYGSARDDAAREAAEDYTEGRQEADDAQNDLPDDDDGNRRWLHIFAD